jgi:mycothiol synthase
LNGELPTNLTIRAYRGEADIPAIAALHNAAALVDGPEDGRTEEEVRHFLTRPTVMPEENVYLFEVNGHLVAFGHTELEEGPEESVFELQGIVHPGWRRRGIGTRLMERIEQRARARLSEVKNPVVYLATGTNLKFEDRQALYARMGYERVRYFFNMERPLCENGIPLKLPQPVYPPGIVVRTMAERSDLHAVSETCHEAFRDHWGHTEHTFEQWQHWTTDPDYRPERWLIAWDDEQDAPAGVCLNGVEADHNARVGRLEGWVYVLAVRRPYRRQGLGRALLLAGLGVLQQEGMDWAMLGVDTENLTGALGLYEGVGFRPVKKFAAFRKVLSAQ